MKKTLLTFTMAALSFVAIAQPGELPVFYLESQPFEAVDQVILNIEYYVSDIDSQVLLPDTLKDSALLYTPFRPYSSLQIKPTELPGTYRPEMLAFVHNDEIVKIVFGSHTFHFDEGVLLRSWQECSQVTAMGQCGGFVTKSNTYFYWSGDRVHRSIGWQSHSHPCGCIEEMNYEYKQIKALLYKAENMLDK
jgi:hypothetical protein